VITRSPDGCEDQDPRTTATAGHEHVHDHVNVHVDVHVLVDVIVIGFCHAPGLGKAFQVRRAWGLRPWLTAPRVSVPVESPNSMG
jgi:hypothetical protein